MDLNGLSRTDKTGYVNGGSERAKSTRGNYLCGNCNQPKKGHKCPYEMKYRRPGGTPDIQKGEKETQAAALDETVKNYKEKVIPGSYDSYLL